MRPALTYDPAELACRSAYVAERAGRIVAFYVFSTLDGERFLDDFWVDAPFIGRGIGACLWRHAVETARADGDAAFFIESDPNAAGFYERMGAVRAGERVSPATGRTLPLMRFALA